ncbi:hypothetical protein [Mesoterricola sediminis]|uniref:Uncharacterized protein n=1 Tax=Mesoterricola sediminis TaxID=2927980 RepID=A0AA48GVA3_9BACT|nr:hypothetical protein [Mesoterricola sediminis]BDU76285.1 hypothetical protein METESE_12430 [Mesoterricola sediminis]
MLDRLKTALTRYRWIGPVLLALACLWIALDVRSCTARRSMDNAAQQADQSHETAVIAAAQGAAHDAEAQAREAKLQDAEARVARLKAQLSRLQAAPLAPVPPVGTVPPVVAGGDNAGGEPGIQPAGDPEKAVLRELVQAQDVQIQGLKAQLNTVTLSRDSWRMSAQARAQESIQLRASLAAAQGLAKAEYWRGFRTGLLAGGLTGGTAGVYAGMRIH